MRWATLTVAMALIVAACGGSNDGSGSAASAPEPDLSPADPGDWRFLEAEGTVVLTRSAVAGVPERATSLEVTTTVIDSGSGPVACLTVVNDSLPPSCPGTPLSGLTMDPSWTERMGEVEWGRRTLEITWPPDDDGLLVLGDREHDRGPAYSDVACTDPCTDDDRYSADELRTAQRAVESLEGVDPNMLGAGGADATGRVLVILLVADRESVRRVTELVDDPAMLRVVGTSVILAGE